MPNDNLPGWTDAKKKETLLKIVREEQGNEDKFDRVKALEYALRARYVSADECIEGCPLIVLVATLSRKSAKAMIDVLLESGAAPNASNKRGKTALLAACSYSGENHDKVIDRLLAHPKINVNADLIQDPLVMSIVLGEFTRVEKLVKAGAVLNVPRRLYVFIPEKAGIPCLVSLDKMPPDKPGDVYKFVGKTPVEIARELGREKIAQMIEERMQSAVKQSPASSPRSHSPHSQVSKSSFYSLNSENSFQSCERRLKEEQLNEPLLPNQRSFPKS